MYRKSDSMRVRALAGFESRTVAATKQSRGVQRRRRGIGNEQPDDQTVSSEQPADRAGHCGQPE